MQNTNLIIGVRLFLLGFVILLIGLAIYGFNYNRIYNSIKINANENNVLECGNYNYKATDFIENVSGEIVSVLKDVNVEEVGKQEVIFEVEKNNIIRKVPLVVEVVDKSFPIVNLEHDTITINSATNYDIYSNILNVTDDFDGYLEYKDISLIDEDTVSYYTVIGNVDSNVVGSNVIMIKAVDSSGNITIKDFRVNVITHGKENDIKNTAYSLLGSPYVLGGSSPSGFDCSGFVYYVYRSVGLTISRNANTQLYDGISVDYNNILVGDILVWGYDLEHVTHTAIYVGDGLMIHAANPSEGVVLDNVEVWRLGTSVNLLSVVRVQ